MSWLRALTWLILLTALLSGLAVTGSRLWPAHSYPTAVLTSFTPLALAAYVVCLLAITALGYGQWTGAWTALTALIVGVASLHVVWLAPSFTGSAVSQAPGQHLRVLTINTQQGAADTEQIVAAVDDLEVDVLVLEEITPQLAERLRGNGLGERLPHEAGEGKPTYAGTVVFSAFPLGDQRRVPTFFDSLLVTVALPDGPMRLVAVHPVHPLRSAADWQREHALIRTAAVEADLVAGDFNATLDHRPMRLLADQGFRSVAEITGTGWAPTWPSNGRGRLPGPLSPRLVQIDHIMVSSGWVVVDVRRVPIDDTDHTGVFAEIARSD
jgi:endonuclease/exonuclease/phosphatase family metal-dependent hydrolase